MSSKIILINFTNLSSEEKEMVLDWRNYQDIRKWMKNKNKITLEEHLNYIKSLDDKKERIYFLAKEKDKYLGVIDFTDIIENENAEFGIYAKPGLFNVGSKLMSVIIDYAFNTLELKKLIANVYIDNEKAIKLYKKFNFQEIKINKDNNRDLIQMELKNENW